MVDDMLSWDAHIDQLIISRISIVYIRIAMVRELE
jgi:hypothetical protein